MKKKFMLLTAVLTTFLVLINSLFAIDNITLDHSVNSALTQQKQSEQMSISDVQANTSLIEQKKDVTKSKSLVFGYRLFSSQCDKIPQFASYNPAYIIAIGDQISLQMWGAFTYSKIETVDSQGNIFLPNIGPVQVANLPNSSLNEVVKDAVKKVFKANVESYANLLTAQPVKVFVAGYVEKPGLYAGISSDSALYFLCQAGGILPTQGSFRNIRVMRGHKVIANIDLYDFLLNGSIPYTQLQQGDSVVVSALRGTVQVTGEVRTPGIYETTKKGVLLEKILALAGALPSATYALIADHKGLNPTQKYLRLDQLGEFKVYSGDTINVTSDQNQNEVVVQVTGAADGAKQFVLPQGTSLEKLVNLIKLRTEANIEDLQLFRESVAREQSQAIDQSLAQLQRKVFTDSPLTSQGAIVQESTAKLVSQFIEQAKKIQPKGQVVVGKESLWGLLTLQDHDVINIPMKTNVVNITGEVLSPIALTLHEDYTVNDYIKAAGGFTQSALTDYVLVLKQNGTIKQVTINSWFGGGSSKIQGGDQIMVLAKGPSEKLSIAGAVSQIIYQVAVAAKVALVW